MDGLPQGLVVMERGWLSSNNIFFVDPVRPAIVDSGYATQAALTVDLVRRAFAGSAPALLVNTHLHSDHCGGNALLQQVYPSMRTLIPPGEAPHVKTWDPLALSYGPTGQQCPRFSFDGVLTPGSEVQLGASTWQVHAAPGHDPHSVVLFEPLSRTLISADALWENGFGVVFPEIAGEPGFEDVGRTLDLIDQLAPRIVIPGHGAVFTDVDAALSRARDRLAGQMADPARHAKHAAKVLLKFKLMDRQAMELQDCLAWADDTRYFRLLHARWFAGDTARGWIESLVADLVRSGALRLEAGRLFNA